MDFIKYHLLRSYETKSAYIQKKALYYQNIFLATALYILMTTTLYYSWFHDTVTGMVIILLLFLSGLLFLQGNIIPSQLSLFFCGNFVLLSMIDKVTTFHFFGNFVLFVFISVIVCIKPWQIVVTYISSICLLFYRFYLATASLAHSSENLFIVHDTIFILFSVLTLMLLAIYLEKMIQRGIIERIELSNSSEVDLLTKLYTRQKLYADVKALNQTSYELAILDIDFFKTVNDTYGHNAGDKLLQELSELMLANFKTPLFTVYRWGGEEFVIVSKKESSPVFDERLNNFRELVERTFAGSKISITISIGSYRVNSNFPFTQAFSICDQALYTSKRTGRNKLTREGMLS